MSSENNESYIELLRERWYIVIALLLAGIVIAVGITASTASKYTASADVFVATGGGGSVESLYTGSSFTQSQMQSYASLVTTSAVLGPAARELGVSVESLSREVTSSVDTGSVLMSVSATTGTPSYAARVANIVASSVTSVIPRVGSVRVAGSSPIHLTVVDRATPPATASSPKAKLNVALGAVLGVILGIVIAVLRGVFDNKLRTLGDVQAVTQVPVLGEIPRVPNKSGPSLAFTVDGKPALAEAFRSLRGAVQQTKQNMASSRPLLITSTAPSEGKSVSALNLGAAFAEDGWDTVVVEADLRRPSLAGYLGADGGNGIAQVLSGDVSLDDALHDVFGVKRLRVLFAGSQSNNVAEVLGSSRFDDLLRVLAARFPVVIIDSPPIGVVADAGQISKRADTLFIVGAGRAKAGDVRRAAATMALAGAHIIGFVLVGTRYGPRAGGYGGYYRAIAPLSSGSTSVGSGSSTGASGP